MKKAILIILASGLTVAASAQSKPDEAFKPDPDYIHTFQFSGKIADLQGLFNVVGHSSIEDAPDLSGAAIKQSEKSTRAILDAIGKQYQEQISAEHEKFKADSLRKAKPKR